MESRVKDSEFDKYVDRAYKQLKDEYYRTKYAGGVFKCPFCMEKKNQEYSYDDLLHHARSRGKGSKDMSLRQQGQHVALSSYLSRYHGPKVPSKPSSKGGSHNGCDNSSSMVIQSSGKKMHVGHDNNDIHVSKMPKASEKLDAYVEQDKRKKFQCDSSLRRVLQSSGKEMYVGQDNDDIPVSKMPQSFEKLDAYVEQDKSKKFQCDSSSRRVLQSSGKEMHVGHDNDDIHLSKMPKSSEKLDAHVEQDKSKKFVFPWKGIIVNVPVECKDGRYVGESGNKLKEQLVEQGFNPLKVTPLWGRSGHSGRCIVDFVGDWSGFGDAMKFEKAFEVNHHGKKDWYRAKYRGHKLFGWVATEEDYQSEDLVGKHLQKYDLNSIDSIEAEENRKTRSLVSQLTSTIEAKNLQYKMMESKLHAASISMNLVMKETDAMTEAHNKEMSEMRRTQRDDMERMLVEHERIIKKIESKKKQLKLREKELEKREAQNENEQKELSRQQKMNELAYQEQKKADENMLRLAEEQKREKEVLHKKIIDLEKELDHKQALELEIERMRGAMQVMKHMGHDEDIELKKKMESIAEELQDKEEELEATEELKQALIVKEHKASEELQEARKELIKGLQIASSRGARPSIGVKNIGELDGRPFEIGAKRKYPKDMASEKATEWWSLWETCIKDTNWRPFKCISEKGINKEVIDEEDERLRELRNELGEEPYKAVVTALIELNEYSPQDRNPLLELWNFKKEKRAKLCEGAAFLINQWKQRRRR